MSLSQIERGTYIIVRQIYINNSTRDILNFLCIFENKIKIAKKDNNISPTNKLLM